MANFFKKQLEELNKIEKNAKKAKIKNQCKCNHRDDDGDLTLASVENGGKVNAYKCTSCDGIIAIKAPTPQEVKDAVNVIITSLDYFKIVTMKGPNNLNKLSEGEAADRKLVASVMEFLISYRNGYEKALERNQKRNQNRRKNTRRSTTSFMG